VSSFSQEKCPFNFNIKENNDGDGRKSEQLQVQEREFDYMSGIGVTRWHTIFFNLRKQNVYGRLQYVELG